MAANRFSQLKVKRRWGAYQCDIGRYEVILRDGSKSTIVYADGKHYVDKPELLVPILEIIYSFEAEFGQPLDYGPIATTCIRDRREIIAVVSVSFCVFCCIAISAFIWVRTRKKKGAEPIAAPETSPR